MHEIALEHTTDTGHRIVGHKGKCARIHGHTYKWEVSVVAESLLEIGFVVDFGDIKDILNEWDHRLVLWDQDPIYQGMARPGIIVGSGELSEEEIDRMRRAWHEPHTSATGILVLPEGATYSPPVDDHGIVGVAFNPTAELMAQDRAIKIGDMIGNGAHVMVTTWETPKCSATYSYRARP